MLLRGDVAAGARLHVHTDDRFAKLAHGVKAGIAELQAQLVFALRVETPVAFMARGKSRARPQHANVNFGMNFPRDHQNSPQTVDGTLDAKTLPQARLNTKDLKQRFTVVVGEFARAALRISRKDTWLIERTSQDIDLTCTPVWDKR